MLCRFMASDGTCTDKYHGYACIRSNCTHWKEAHECEYHSKTGDYCEKYARFGCVGKESCHTLSEYMRATAEAELT
jgi:hypothetical protein